MDYLYTIIKSFLRLIGFLPNDETVDEPIAAVNEPIRVKQDFIEFGDFWNSFENKINSKDELEDYIGEISRMVRKPKGNINFIGFKLMDYITQDDYICANMDLSFYEKGINHGGGADYYITTDHLNNGRKDGMRDLHKRLKYLYDLN